MGVPQFIITFKKFLAYVDKFLYLEYIKKGERNW